MADSAKSECEIEVTPEMIEAGCEMLWNFDLMHPTEDELKRAARAVYKAMVISRRVDR